MFKMIGAMVVYGFALYGVVDRLNWLNEQLDERAKRKVAPEAGVSRPA